MKRRSLTEEEKRLWKHVTRDAESLHPDVPEEPAISPPPEAEEIKPRQVKQVVRRTSAPPPAPAPNEEVELKRGVYAGIDRATSERFRKGNYPIDATLDLHGMNREKAHTALHAFLRAHHSQGSRCLLVITGKGTRAAAAEKPGRGILREMLPQWLTDPGLQPLVLAFDVARPKHGGSGAYYILLRRKRP